MNQLKKLGFSGPALDHAANETEGVIVHTFGPTWVWFVFKSKTNSFTQGLFQFVCARAAALGKGRVYLECDQPAEAGLLAAIQASAMLQYITNREPVNRTTYGTAIYEVFVEYEEVQL